MATKPFFSTLLTVAAAVLISCSMLPSGHEAGDSRSQIKKDGELALPVGYRDWDRFVSTVERNDKEEIREIYISGQGAKGTESDGFPNGTTFVMEIFAAKRGSLILMPNATTTADIAGGWHVDIYVQPQSLLLPTDTPGRCRLLSSEGCGWSFIVKGRALDTGIHVPKGAVVRIVSTGAIRFDPRSAPRDADGIQEISPPAYPAPALRKHSLLCKVGNSEWVQCGTSASFKPEGTKTLLRTTEGKLVKGKLQGLFLMQKGPNWGKETGYETGDWVFDHYRPLVGQLCAEELGVSSNGAMRCVAALDIGRQHEKVAHENRGKDCRRCHTPAMSEASAHDRDFIYGYDQHFKVLAARKKSHSKEASL